MVFWYMTPCVLSILEIETPHSSETMVNIHQTKLGHLAIEMLTVMSHIPSSHHCMQCYFRFVGHIKKFSVARLYGIEWKDERLMLNKKVFIWKEAVVT
jgi:hypothetical protein